MDLFRYLVLSTACLGISCLAFRLIYIKQKKDYRRMWKKNLPVILLVLLAIPQCREKNNSGNSPVAYKDKEFTEIFRRRDGWIAGDGAFSIPFGEKTLWTFGDSYIDCLDTVTGKVPCLFQARNAVMIIGRENVADVTTPGNVKNTPTFFTYGTDSKYWFWPTSGFASEDTIYVFLSRLRSTNIPGMWGFEGVDSNYVASISPNDLSRVNYRILPSKNGINFGVSAIEKGKYTLVYGIRSNGFGNDLYLARFLTENIYLPWQYHDGKSWTDDVSLIKKIHSEFTSSFYLCRVRNKYLLITTEFSVGCDQGKNILVAVADTPHGPFINQHSVWQVDDTLNGHFPFWYCANAHPEFDNGKNELLITYCINSYGDCINTCIDNRLDPDVYRPKAVRVPYSVIFGSALPPIPAGDPTQQAPAQQ